MKTLDFNPFSVDTGQVLTPTALNDAFDYAKRAYDNIVEQRYVNTTLPLQLGAAKSLSFLTSNTTSSEGRSFRIRPFQDVIVDRAFLSANLVSTGEVYVTITDSVGVTPSGATTPWLTTSAAVASAVDDVTDIATERFTLTSGTEYVVTVGAAAGITYTLSRFDVIAHVRAAYAAGGIDSTAFTDASARDAVAVADAAAFLASAASSASISSSPMLPVIYAAPQLASAVDARFVVPRVASADTLSTIGCIDIFVAPESVGTPTTVTATLKDDTGATLSTVAVTFTSTTALQWNRVTPTIALPTTPSTVPADPTKDYVLTLTSTNASPVFKAYAVVWYYRP